MHLGGKGAVPGAQQDGGAGLVGIGDGEVFVLVGADPIKNNRIEYRVADHGMYAHWEEIRDNGVKFISINPVRTGYSAIADEWVPIKPGTDGALLLAVIHELIKQGLYDREFLVQYTNAAELVVDDPQRDDHGLFHRVEMHVEEGCFDPENKLWWDREIGPIGTHTPGADPRLLGEF